MYIFFLFWIIIEFVPHPPPPMSEQRLLSALVDECTQAGLRLIEGSVEQAQAHLSHALLQTVSAMNWTETLLQKLWTATRAILVGLVSGPFQKIQVQAILKAFLQVLLQVLSVHVLLDMLWKIWQTVVQSDNSETNREIQRGWVAYKLGNLFSNVADKCYESKNMSEAIDLYTKSNTFCKGTHESECLQYKNNMFMGTALLQRGRPTTSSTA